MMKESRFHARLWPLPWVVALVFLLSCGPDVNVVGIYKAEPMKSGKQVEILVDLKANGEGTWKIGGEEVPFSWYLKRGELRVNTRGGGVIVGSIEKNTIRMNLPGTGTFSFKKIQ